METIDNTSNMVGSTRADKEVNCTASWQPSSDIPNIPPASEYKPHINIEFLESFRNIFTAKPETYSSLGERCIRAAYIHNLEACSSDKFTYLCLKSIHKKLCRDSSLSTVAEIFFKPEQYTLLNSLMQMTDDFAEIVVDIACQALIICNENDSNENQVLAHQVKSGFVKAKFPAKMVEIVKCSDEPLMEKAIELLTLLVPLKFKDEDEFAIFWDQISAQGCTTLVQRLHNTDTRSGLKVHYIRKKILQFFLSVDNREDVMKDLECGRYMYAFIPLFNKYSEIEWNLDDNSTDDPILFESCRHIKDFSNFKRITDVKTLDNDTLSAYCCMEIIGMLLQLLDRLFFVLEDVRMECSYLCRENLVKQIVRGAYLYEWTFSVTICQFEWENTELHSKIDSIVYESELVPFVMGFDFANISNCSSCERIADGRDELFNISYERLVDHELGGTFDEDLPNFRLFCAYPHLINDTFRLANLNSRYKFIRRLIKYMKGGVPEDQQIYAYQALIAVRNAMKKLTDLGKREAIKWLLNKYVDTTELVDNPPMHSHVMWAKSFICPEKEWNNPQPKIRPEVHRRLLKFMPPPCTLGKWKPDMILVSSMGCMRVNKAELCSKNEVFRRMLQVDLGKCSDSFSLPHKGPRRFMDLVIHVIREGICESVLESIHSLKDASRVLELAMRYDVKELTFYLCKLLAYHLNLDSDDDLYYAMDLEDGLSESMYGLFLAWLFYGSDVKQYPRWRELLQDCQYRRKCLAVGLGKFLRSAQVGDEMMTPN